MIAAIILLVLQLISLGKEMALHGAKKKEKKHNAWAHFIALVIVLTLYYYAGVFNNFN